MSNKTYIPLEFLNWREGDPVTSFHRNILSTHISNAFNLSLEKSAEIRERDEKVPDEHIAIHTALLIAETLDLDPEKFGEMFPIAAGSDSLAIKTYLKYAPIHKGRSNDDAVDLGNLD